MSVSTCVGDPVARVGYCETVGLPAEYNGPHVPNDVIGRMLGFINPS